MPLQESLTSPTAIVLSVALAIAVVWILDTAFDAWKLKRRDKKVALSREVHSIKRKEDIDG